MIRRSVIWMALGLLLVLNPGASSAQSTSEEFPPVTCAVDSFVVGLTCRGQYCDNVGIQCRAMGGLTWRGEAIFQPFVSEEKGGRRDCPAGSVVAGLACNGQYCDNLSILCVQITGGTLSSCEESSTVSEEGGGRLTLDNSRVATGLTCSGQYCDNKKLIGCRM